MLRKAVASTLVLLGLTFTATQAPTAVAETGHTPSAQPISAAGPQCPVEGGASENPAPTEVSPQQRDNAISLAKAQPIQSSSNSDLNWDKATVHSVTANKFWVTVAPTEGQQQSDFIEFHRIAVDLDRSEVATTQTYRIAPLQDQNGKAESWLLTDGRLLWHGYVTQDGDVTTAGDSPLNPNYSSRGGCEWGMGVLCGTGGSAACYGACAALGLVNGIAGLGCAAVCGLISALGCTAATEAVCG